MPATAPTQASGFPWPDGKRAAVSLSFDDARESQLEAGIPVLDRHGVRATFYVMISRMEPRLRQWERVRDAGHEIGNHTLTHPCSGNFAFSRKNSLEEYTLDRIEQDMLAANEKIQSMLGVRPTTFAYPCGQTFVGRGVALQSYIPIVAKHFRVGRGAFNEGPNDPSFCDLANAFAMDMDGATFERLRELVDKSAAEGMWLILLAHDVGDHPRQAIRAEVLDQLCRYCTDPARGLWCDTVAKIGDYVAARQRL